MMTEKGPSSKKLRKQGRRGTYLSVNVNYAIVQGAIDTPLPAVTLSLAFSTDQAQPDSARSLMARDQL